MDTCRIVEAEEPRCRERDRRIPPSFGSRSSPWRTPGRTPEELAKEFEPSDATIRNWIAQADRDEGVCKDGLTSAEKEELRRLRRENTILRQEKEIPKKAAAWFARESGSIPDRDSSS